jgi:hypothetical protein
MAPASWTQNYETLRQHVLDRRQALPAEPLGLVLLCRRGVAGWMRGWAELARPTAPLPPTQPAPRPALALCQQELTILLAQITVQNL